MTASDEEQRRERLRALQKLRGQVASQQTTGAGASQGDKQPQGGNQQRGTKLRALLQRRQAQQGGGGGGGLMRALSANNGGGAAGSAGNPGARGGGLLRAALANRAGNNSADTAGGSIFQAGAAANAEGKGARSGNPGQLIRRIVEARQARDAGADPGQYAQQILELQNRVNHLTAEVERLVANQESSKTAVSQTSADADTKQPTNQPPAAGTSETAEQAPTPGKAES